MSLLRYGTLALTEYTKTQHYSLEENTKQNILTQGLYHFTSKEVADRIVQDGYFKPTKGIIDNHFGKDKVYMFAGLPNITNFAKNLPAHLNPFVSGNLEFSAVRLNPNQDELDNFKERLQDSAIVYEGRYDIFVGRAKSVELVVDLNENGELIFREKTPEELENGYKPSVQLEKYINQRKIGKTTHTLKVLGDEIKAGMKSIPKALPRFYKDFKKRSERKREIKEFEPYLFEMGIKSGQNEFVYNVSCDQIEFEGDKKLHKVKIEKTDKETGDIKSFECYMDNHMLNLGEDAAVTYLSALESAMSSNSLYRLNGLFYAGQPIVNTETGQIAVGVDCRFHRYLCERMQAEFLGKRREASNDAVARKAKEYYKRHPIRKFIDDMSMKKSKTKRLLGRDDIGKFTNEKLRHFSIKDIETVPEQSNGFEASKMIDFDYKRGSRYSVAVGDTVEMDGKTLRKLIVSEESTYLTETLDDTRMLPQNYYVDDIDFEKISKKDLAKYLSSLQYDVSQEEVHVESHGFVGKYAGGISIDKKGKIKEKTYDASLFKKYGNMLHIPETKKQLDLSEYVNDVKTSNEYYLRSAATQRDTISYTQEK